MRIPSLILWCAAGISLSAAEFNPMQLQEYRQTLTVEFSDAAAAEKAVLCVRPLPERKTIAISARWDDTAAGHANTIEIMNRQGAKGTFYYNRMNPTGTKIAKRILECGSSIGVHTVTHRDLSTVNPEGIFHDIMRNRLEIETTLKTPATTTVLPYCSFANLYPYSERDVGKAFWAAGLIGAPDVFYPNFGDRLGVPYTGFAESQPVKPGDRKVDLPKFRKSVAKVLANSAAMQKHPSFSVSMHSWHPKEELPLLEQAFQELSNNPDAWYCNQNDYAAYRYECFQMPEIVNRDGKTVTVSLRRIRPDQLGARPELWLEANAPVISVKGGTLSDGLIRVPADADQPDLAEYSCAKANGTVPEIPGISVKFTRPAFDQWLLTVKNNTAEPITDLNARIHLSPRWNDVTRVPQMQTIPAGKSAEFSFTAKTTNALRYQFGNPYSVVSFDATIAGKRCRIYADILEEKEHFPQSEASAMKMYAGVVMEDDTAAALSVPGTVIPTENTTPVIFQPERFTAPGCTYIAGKQFYLVREKQPMYGVLDFKSAAAQDLTVRTNLKTVFCNGKKLPPAQKGILVLPLKAGVNRLVTTGPLERKWQLFLNDPGAEKPNVEFLP